ncbi:GNAT family N-acetyltransferase [Candidatus Thorarchaeota archaeon]|nr:MAG: GNAT family N-acetyltransferase [Candidatus Thorarchaeota archaeon]
MSSKREIQIRAPTIKEKDEFYKVYKSGLPGVDEISSKDFAEWWKRSYEKGDLEKLWRVAVHGDAVIAVIINLVNEQLNWGFVWELAVHPEYRNQDIGTKLILESEKLLQRYHPEIMDLAIGVKTNNLRAMALYEKLNYGIRFLELRLRGKRWSSEQRSELSVEAASLDRIKDLMKLVPHAYWGMHSEEVWKEIIKPEDRMLVTKMNRLVGFVRVTKQKKKTSSSDIQFNIKPGYGMQVLNSCMELIDTDYIELWIENNHQDILDTLYSRGFKRIESEFLLRKSLPR